MSFDSLPLEVQLLIFSYLSQDDLCVASKVSKKWRQIAGNEHLWRNVVICNCSGPKGKALEIINYCDLVEEVVFFGIDYWPWIPYLPERKYLKKFEFRYCDIEPHEMSMMVVEVPQIKYVDFVDTDYDEQIIEEILMWKKLKRLDIEVVVEQDGDGGSDGLEHLALLDFEEDCPCLKRINFSFNGLVDEDLFSMFSSARGADVRCLSLNCKSFLGRSSYESLKMYSSLMGLRLYNTEFMVDEDLLNIKTLTSLRELHISCKAGRQRWTTSNGYEDLFKDAQFPNLTAIYLKSSNIDDIGLKNLTESCPNLKTLELCRCQKISSVGLNSIMANCKQLKNLFLVGLPKIKRSSIKQLPLFLRDLECLYVKFCRKIYPSDVLRLKFENPGLDVEDRRLSLKRKNEFQIVF